jgi:hypothetical protein
VRAAVSLSSDGSDGSDLNTSDGSDPGSEMDSPRCRSECRTEALIPVRAILARCGVGALPTPSRRPLHALTYPRYGGIVLTPAPRDCPPLTMRVGAVRGLGRRCSGLGRLRGP